MWWASAVLPAPSTSPRIGGARAHGASHVLEHEHGGALGDHEAVAVAVERACEMPVLDSAVMLVKPASAVGCQRARCRR